MTTAWTASETVEYRLVLIHPVTRTLLAFGSAGHYCLPRVKIQQWTRPAQQLRKVIENRWGLDVIILDIAMTGDCRTPCAVAEVATPKSMPDSTDVRIGQILGTELSETERTDIESLLMDKANRPFARIGWIDEARAWIESVTGQSFSSRRDIEQLNAGYGFALLRFRSDDGWDCWLKATGEPNIHELSITSFLSKACGRYLPEFIAARPEWNAWLTSGEGVGITEFPPDPRALSRLLEGAVSSMAELQMKTAGRKLDLLEAGAFDQELSALVTRSEEFFNYLEEAMSRQTSKKVARLGKRRIDQLREIFENICLRVDALGIPSSVLHGDLNPANILVAPGHCRFIDWCETYVGNPLITLEHLLLLNHADDPADKAFIDRVLKDKYRTVLSGISAPEAIDAGVPYMPFLGAFSALYGRGDWLATPLRDDPRRQAYARTLARHMDRAASDPVLLDSLQVTATR